MAPQIGFHGLAPRSRAHLCFTMVEGSNRRREEGNVSRGFRVPRATALAGSDWFLRCKSVPNLAKNPLPFNAEQLRVKLQGLFIVSRYSSRSGNPGAPRRHSRHNGNPEPLLCVMKVVRKGMKVAPSTRRIFVAMTVSAHSQGSGFLLRRE